MPTRMWQRHFNWLVTFVVVVGLATGAALAGFTRPAAPAVVALPAGGQSSGSTFGGNGGAGRQGVAEAASAPSSRPVVGTVSGVDSDTLTVKGQQGDVKVKLSTAKVLKTADGTASDLKTGERVSITAQQEADGSFTATSVQIVPAGQTGQASTAGRAAAAGSAAAGQNGARAQGNGGTGGQGGARPIVGTISSFDGTVLTISTQQGDTKVKLGSAHIQKTVDGTAKDLQADQRVMIMGQQGADGSYDSAEVEILPAVSAQPTASSGSRQ